MDTPKSQKRRKPVFAPMKIKVQKAPDEDVPPPPGVLDMDRLKGDPQAFDNFYIQYSYSRDDKNRPNWIDMSIESVGVLSGKDILKYAIGILKTQIDSYMKEAVEKINRESEKGSYNIKLNQGGHTIGALFQEVMYGDENVEFVGYDIPHPLRDEMVLRFHTKKSPEAVLKIAGESIKEYCSVVEKAL